MFNSHNMQDHRERGLKGSVRIWGLYIILIGKGKMEKGHLQENK